MVLWGHGLEEALDDPRLPRLTSLAGLRVGLVVSCESGLSFLVVDVACESGLSFLGRFLVVSCEFSRVVMAAVLPPPVPSFPATPEMPAPPMVGQSWGGA